VLLDHPELVGGRAWALLANHAAVTVDLRPARAALAGVGLGPLQRLFAPEHGLEGVAQDMEAVADTADPVTGAPVSSLYGHDAASLEPRPEQLEEVEVVLVDLPDIGSRYYTFAATMDAMMAACARRGVEVVVLDRPNPINGICREGGLVEPGFESFVSRLPVPVRHGMTLGELALLLQRDRHSELALSVVRCEGWQRRQWWQESGLPWVPPSPNMPTLETAALYPGLCLVEATNLSEGRGTTRPFHLVGAPWVDAPALTDRLRGLSLPGVLFRPAWFRPAFQKHAGVVCQGVEIHVADRRQLRPVALGVHLLRQILEVHPERFGWRREAYEFVAEIPAIDLLTGSSRTRACLERDGSIADVLSSWQTEVREFTQSVQGLLLYR
jgi:uncharacterized protein YbbC (DUF1343 family)